jgi:putative transposase
VSDHQADYPIATMCQLLGVSPSGYYAWRKRQPSQRSETDAALIAEIQVAHAGSRGTYGVPRIHAELAAKGTYIGRKRVARLMTQAGLAGVSRRRFVTTTVKDGGRQAPDLVERNFTAEAPDRLWVADITYIPTWAGFLYLAVVLDAYSRRIVGWSMATTLAKQLVLDALNMALAARRPRGVIHHSDQGSQYTSIEFGQHCRKAGVRPSMGSVGDAGACPRAGEAGPGGQRHVRELLCHPRMRASRAAPLQDAGRGAKRSLRLHRGVLQSAPPPLLDRISFPDGL